MELSDDYKKLVAKFEKTEPTTKRVGPTPGYPQGATIFTQEKRDGARTRIVKSDGEPVNGKKVKHVFIEATFPELKGGASRQSAHGEASGTKPAIARAFKNLLKTIPKKRISVISAKISITTKIVEG
jgi:hypothetical protein